MTSAPHLLYLAFGFPPAAKSSTFRLRETANQFAELGWDVTVVNSAREGWENDYGLDLSLLDGVDPRIELVELPLFRRELETDIRSYSQERARNPVAWNQALNKRNLKAFPEPAFGGWRKRILKEARELCEKRRPDLLVVTCVPYVLLSVALKLHEEFGIPYAVDFRDGWSIDVVKGVEAFEVDSRKGRIEKQALDSALSLWVVNDPIAEHYRARYPEFADRVHVVRNGYDAGSVPALPDDSKGTDPADGTARRPLRLGYLGSVNFSAGFFRDVVTAWRIARERDPLLHDAVLDMRGHIGSGWQREANAITEIIAEAREVGITFGGAVPKSEVAATYAGWDALVLMLIGGRFVTSGKVYEYMATGLPIMSVHEAEHDAAVVLEGYPAWTGARGTEVEEIARMFSEVAAMAEAQTPDDRRRAAAHAARFERTALMRPAVSDLAHVALAGEEADRG